MLPGSVIDESLEKIKGSDKSFKIDFENKTIGEIIEGKEALGQAIHIALITQRYKYPVFSHAFGTELEKAFEEGYMKAMGKVKNAICDSLLCDDRITGIESFEFERQGTKMGVKFTVRSIYGTIDCEEVFNG